MGKRPKLDGLEYLLDRGEAFQLTGKEYEVATGIPLPKGAYYLRKESALAQWAMERGYYISEIQESCVPERTVFFKKSMYKEADK